MLQVNMKGNDAAEILIYDDIGGDWLGGISAKDFAEDLKKVGKVKNLEIRINSYGGSVFDGVAIYNTLRKTKATKIVYIDGIAASIASIIAMAGDEIYIAENGFIMIHDPWSVAMGTADDLRHEAGLMDKIRESLLDTYLLKTNAKRDRVSEMMKSETWFDASEAVELGFADGLANSHAIAASANPFWLARLKNIPAAIPQKPEKINKDKSTARKLQYVNAQRILRKFAI